MAKSLTTRFSLQRWTADGDTIDRSEIDTSFANLELLAAGWIPGTTEAERPAASAANARSFHRATDTGRLSYSTGLGWQDVPEDADITAAVSNHEGLSDPHTGYLQESAHTKAAHDALGIDADTVDGSHAAALLDRANHTGTQAASTISDFAEAVSDQVGGMVAGNTETGIAVTYQDADNTLDFAVAYGTPVTLNPDAANSAGTGSLAARSNHVHNVPAATAVDLTDGSASAEGAATSFARADHTHAISGFVTSSSHTAAQHEALSIDHGSLAGRSDDDHTQYLLTAGTRAMAGALDMGTNFINNVTNPSSAQDAATKAYVDGQRFDLQTTGDAANAALSTTSNATHLTLNFSDPGGPVRVMVVGWARSQQTSGSAGVPIAALNVTIDGNAPADIAAEEFAANFVSHTGSISHGRAWTPTGAFTVTLQLWQAGGSANDLQHLGSGITAIMIPG